jgi:hypothetical protein
MILDPPGCGAQAVTEFCPYGCTSNGECNFDPDGGVPSGCVASSATFRTGILAGRGPGSAATQFLPDEARIVVATNRSAACAAAAADGGPPGATSGASLTLSFPNHLSGQVAIGAGAGAHLSAWTNGALTKDNVAAASGMVEVNTSDPNGGTIGRYDLTFESTHEQGTFIAPLCDICAAGP